MLLDEDQVLAQFERSDNRMPNQSLTRRLREAEDTILQLKHKTSGMSGLKELRERADRFERLYKATLQRNEILARKVKELGG